MKIELFTWVQSWANILFVEPASCKERRGARTRLLHKTGVPRGPLTPEIGYM